MQLFEPFGIQRKSNANNFQLISHSILQQHTSRFVASPMGVVSSKFMPFYHVLGAVCQTIFLTNESSLQKFSRTLEFKDKDKSKLVFEDPPGQVLSLRTTTLVTDR